MKIEHKNTNTESIELDERRKTATLAHCTFSTPDRVGDISRKGMFTNWKDKEDIAFYMNHRDDLVPGKPVEFWEDDRHAYTKVFFASTQFGKDTMQLIKEGILTNVSFGYYVLPGGSKTITMGNQRYRELNKVFQTETSILSKIAAHPGSKVVSVDKAASFLRELKDYLPRLEKFYHNSTASDECLQTIHSDIIETKHLISHYEGNTAPLGSDLLPLLYDLENKVSDQGTAAMKRKTISDLDAYLRAQDKKINQLKSITFKSGLKTASQLQNDEMKKQMLLLKLKYQIK